jgi:hypothetical protein
MSVLGLVCAEGGGNRLRAEGIDVVASQDFVLASAQRTQTTSYGFDMTMRMNLDMGVMAIELEGNEPVATARFDGERMEMRMDIGVMFEEMAESEPIFASALDMMGDTDNLVMYIHAPLFSTAQDAVVGLGPVIDGWGTSTFLKQ